VDDRTDSGRPGSPDLHRSATVRWLLIVAGLIATALGIVGAFLPVLPTTPFLLLAAACFARASPKLDRMLVESKTFGPTILEWRKHRSIPWRTKLVAIGLMSAMILTSATFFVHPWWAKALLVGVGVATGTWLWRIPSRDRPPRMGSRDA
jgi:uncharacterized membrane protein YbaN (DUF454 family)